MSRLFRGVAEYVAGSTEATDLLDQDGHIIRHDGGLRDSPPLQAHYPVLEAHRVDDLAEVGARFADGHHVRDLVHEYMVTDSRFRLPVHVVVLYSLYMSNTTGTPAVTEHAECGTGTVRVLRMHRCQGCGHRVTVDGIAPRQTREQPWRAPAELLGRHLARKAA